MKANDKAIAFLSQYIGKRMAHENPNPITRYLDGILKSVSAGSMTAEFEVREDQCNHAVVLHGGVISMLLDEMMGTTLITCDIEHLYVTINLSIDFLYGAKAGEKITVVSEVFRVGKKVANVEAKMYNAEGKLLAKGSSNLAATSIPFKM